MNWIKKYQKGNRIRDSFIKPYDDSFKANIGRLKGKFREKVPESWRMVLPGVSDAEDIAYLGEAFGPKGTTLDKIIGTAGVALPFVSTGALKPIKPLLKKANLRLGERLDVLLGKYPDTGKIMQSVNERLGKGLGIKKTKNTIKFTDEVGGNMKVLIDNIHTGDIGIDISHKPRGIMDILRGKKHVPRAGMQDTKEVGTVLSRNYPFGKTNLNEMEELYDDSLPFFQEMFSGKGLNAEMIQGINKSSKQSGFPMYSSGSYSWDSLYKYGEDLKSGRVKQVSPKGTKDNRVIYEYKQKGGKVNYISGGGLSRKKDYKSKKKPYPSVKKKDFAGGKRSYPIPTIADAVDALRLAGLHNRPDVRAKVYKKYPSLKKK